MYRKTLRKISLTLIAGTAILAFEAIALAGPPLVCFPFDIGNAASLPFGGENWRAAKPDYDINRLPDDTLALLTPETPVIVRMETLRRATVYAMKDQNIAAKLYARLLQRSRDEQKKPNYAIALFDAGYLIETYKQASPVTRTLAFSESLDGYASVVKAIKLRGSDPDMEFAAALITMSGRHAEYENHLRTAVTGAAKNSLLERNLTNHYQHFGKYMPETRAVFGEKKK